MATTVTEAPQIEENVTDTESKSDTLQISDEQLEMLLWPRCMQAVADDVLNSL